MVIQHPAKRSIRLAVAACLATPAVGLAATFNWNNPDGGAMNIATNWSPVGIPGSADSANLLTTPTLTGFMTLSVPTNMAIGSFVNGHFAQNTIEGPGVLTLQTGGLSFNDSITESPDEALNSLFINAVINSAAGLTKNGNGFVRLGAANLYAGGTFINAGGVTVTADNNFGAAGTGITLNGGTIRAGSGFTTSRAITLGANGGRIESFGNLTISGVLSGSGALTSGRFTGGQLTLSAVNTYAGNTNIDNGSTVNLLGRLTASTAIRLAGTLNLGSSTVGLASNALHDGAVITGLGGRMNVYAPSTSATETVGTLALSNGTTTLNLEANGNAGIALAFAGLTRSNRSTAFVRGRDLGNGAIAPNRAIVKFDDFSSLPLVGGFGFGFWDDPIVPFLLGNANTTGGSSQVSVVDAGFVTRTSTGELKVIPGSRYRTSLTIGTSVDNVRVSDSILTAAASTSMNSLLIRDTLSSNGPTGIQGAGTLNIISGAIGAVSDLSGEELFIDNPINFGSAEGVVHLAPTSDGFSNLTLRGAIAGSGGLTKSGSGELTLTGASSFTGGLVINAGLVNFEGSVGTGASALGSTDAITINAGVSDNQYVGLRAMTPSSTVSRAITVRQTAAGNSLAMISTLGGYGTTFSGPISIEGGYLNLLGDTEPEVLTFSGVISGAGGLREPNTAEPINQFLRITGNNTYSGGTIIRAGRWDVGSDTALGTGVVYFTGESTSGSIHAVGGARSLGNALVLRAAPTFGGSNELNFSGSIDLGSVSRDIVVDNTADTRFSGIVSRGGIVKLGEGRLILSGFNTYNGQTIVTAGELRATTFTAFGAATGNDRQATYIGSTGAIELTGNITTAESFYFGADGLPITAARPDGNLRNVSGNNTITSAVAFDDVGTLGVDSGSVLTLSGDTLDNTPGTNARLRKVGTGTLNVKNVRLDGLVIDAGTIRVTPAGIPTGTSRVESLTIASGATLDLTNNALIYDYDSTSPLASVQAMLLANRIITSVTASGSAIGYAEASSLFTSFPANFAAQSVDSTTVLLIQTLLGDTNLDRTVNFDDLLKLAQNYGTSGKTWVEGDFNYNGLVNFDDLLALAQNYGGTVSLADYAVLSDANSSFASDFALAMALVPEPATLSACLVPAALLRRRR